MSLSLGKQRHQYSRLPVEILHSEPNVPSRFQSFCPLSSGHFSFLVPCQWKLWPVTPLIIGSHVDSKASLLEFVHDVTIKKPCLSGLFL